MKKLTAVLTAVLLLAPCALSAQGTTVELGTGIGAAILTNGGTVTWIGMPGSGVVGQAPLYATLFFGKGIMLQPEISFNLVTGGGSTVTTLAGTANVGYAFSGAGRNSPYITVNAALQYADAEGGSDSEFGAGARVGYRVLVNQGFAVGLEAGFRRWFDSELNEITIAIRLGGIIVSP